MLRDNVPTLGFASGVLVVRVHAASGFSETATAKILVYNQMWRGRQRIAVTVELPPLVDGRRERRPPATPR